MSPGAGAGWIVAGPVRCRRRRAVPALGVGGRGTARSVVAHRRPGRLRLGPAALHELAQLAPRPPPGAGQLLGQPAEEPVHLAPVPFGHAAHHEDGGGGQVGVPGGQVGQPERRHLGVLHVAELVLERGELAHEAGGPPAVDLGAELEGVAQPLAADAQAWKSETTPDRLARLAALATLS